MKKLCDIFGLQTFEVIYKGKFNEKYGDKDTLVEITKNKFIIIVNHVEELFLKLKVMVVDFLVNYYLTNIKKYGL
jgi:hypothetical protein